MGKIIKKTEQGSKMNITVVCDVLGLPNNGTSMAAFNLINSMRDRGHRVKVVCPDVDKSGREDYFITPRYNFGVFINM